MYSLWFIKSVVKKKIFAITANQNTLLALVAIFDIQVVANIKNFVDDHQRNISVKFAFNGVVVSDMIKNMKGVVIPL
jgi:UDP-N-acetylglucosamine transferase subunit ALG13